MKSKLALTALASIALHTAIAQTTNPAPYCDATFDDAQGFLVEDYIGEVTFGTLSNVTNGQYAAPHYAFYNNLATANFNIGTSYDLKLSFEVKGGCGYGVWIDYNQNNIFEADEKVAGTVGTDILDPGSTNVINKSITIPATAKPGPTRMRVRIVEDDNFVPNSSEILACNLSNSATDVMDWGETEDYTINIVNPNSTSIKNKDLQNAIKVYPNPSKGAFTIMSPITVTSYQITNIVGAVVASKTIKSTTQIEISEVLPTGIYIIRLNAEGQELNKKIEIIK